MAYDESWDRTHSPGTDESWQESDCYWFLDRAAGVGGYHRIGQHPNTGNGEIILFAYKAGGSRFRLIREYARDECRRSEAGQVVGGSAVDASGDGRMRFRWSEKACEADLEFHSPFYTPRSWHETEDSDPDASAVKREMNTDGHLEVAGRLRGRIRIGDDHVDLDALAHRDRSWGVRRYASAYQHRMVTGTLGPKLSWATYVMQLDNGHVARAGFVARNGVTTDVRDLRVLTEFDYDGLTVTGMRTRLTLAGGDTVELVGPAVQGFMAVTEGWLVSSHHFIELGDGPGFTVLDATNRPSKGKYVPQASEVGSLCVENGLSRTADPAPAHTRSR